MSLYRRPHKVESVVHSPFGMSDPIAVTCRDEDEVMMAVTDAELAGATAFVFDRDAAGEWNER